MNILIIAPQPFYQERGTPIAVRLLIETLCSMGHRVDVLVFHEGEDISIPGMRLIRAGRPPGIGSVPIGISWQKLVCDLWLIGKMMQLLRRNSYDVVHAVEEAIFPAVALNLFARRKLIYDMDSSLTDQLTEKWRLLRPMRNLLQLFERAAVRRSHAVFAVCEDLAAKVRPWIGAERVLVLPDVPMGNALADDKIEQLKALIGPEQIMALYVGNLEHYQGIDIMLEGLAACSVTNVRLIIIGGAAAHIAQHRDLARSLGIADRVHFLGPRPVANLNAYLTQADILVSPRTLGQNTPMKVYSYMQAGKAILATNIRSHTQALDSSCAELVPATPSGVSKGLQKLAEDAELRRRLGHSAREKVEREYSLPVFQRRLQDGYRKLLTA